MKDVSNNVKQVMVVYIFLFVALISYIAYFQVFTAPKMAEESANPRIAIIKNEVLRGTIYDRDGNALTTSSRVDSTTQSRTYTQGDLFAHALGYSSNIYGVKGLEATYDEELSTYSKLSNNFSSLLNDFSMDKLKTLFESRKEDEEKVGNGIVTTLDTNIQKVAYDALGNNKGAIVVLNPKTGEVLAMVSKPTYNPNNLAVEITQANKGTATNSPFINRVTAGMYPPGSTFKIVTTASALKNMSNATTRIFNDTGKIEFPDGRTLNNDSNAVNGSINLKTAFEKSSNFVYGTLAMELGNDKLKATAESFGFNNSIDGNGVVVENSIFPKLGASEVGNIAQSGIGQSSILATPMQMAVVASTIANNGKMMELSLVNQIVDKDKQIVKTIDPKQKSQVLDTKSAATITEYMKNLVDSKTSSSWSTLQAINAAGKTGTADINDPVTGQPQKPHSWFIGFAPANDPQVAIAVIVENGGYGSEAAAPIAGTVLKAALK